jgi:malate dehydrogenase (oxaloacetate-decarboxylating)(NADP+)
VTSAEGKGEMESTMKGIRGGGAPCVLDMDDAATVGGGVEDTYGEDRATEEQLVTPWTVSVAR